MRDLIVETRNVKMLGRAAQRLLNQSKHTPKIGVVTGPVGLGKTFATRKVCLDEPNAIWIEALPDWTPRWMTRDLAFGLGAGRALTTEQNFRLIVGALIERMRAIFIEEADHLVRRLNLAETLRAIHDATGAPIIFIGMKDLPYAIHRLPQLESRVAHWVTFEPGDLSDTRLMASELCEVEILDDLVKRIHEQTGGNARGVRVALERLESLARGRGKRRLGADDVDAKFDLTYGRAARDRGPAARSATITPIATAVSA